MNPTPNQAAATIVRGAFRPNLPSRALNAVRVWHSRRLAVRELNAMSDQLLRDIGIERYQIKDAVHNFGVKPSVFRLRRRTVAPNLQVAAKKAA